MKVVASDNLNFAAGDFVEGMTGWEYSLIVKTEMLRKIERNDIPLSYHVGLLGIFPQALTSYFDSVGGAMLDAALLNVRPHGQISAEWSLSRESLTRGNP